jgi:hypothetical protein
VDGGGLRAGAPATTRWHFDYADRPPATDAQCRDVW